VTPGAFQTTFTSSGGNSLGDGVVAKLNPTATKLLYATYLSGGSDAAYAVGIDKSGDAYVTGVTKSTTFPVTPKAFQTIFGGIGALGEGDAFISKLNPQGSALTYSTYIGGDQDESGYSIAVDRSGGAWVMGPTDSDNFPVTKNAIQSAYAGPDVSGAGTTFYYGDAFVLRLNPKGSALTFSTYLGGSGDDAPGTLALDPAVGVYITGTTLSTDYPTTVGSFNSACGGEFCGAAYQQFISKIVPGSGATASRRARPSVTGKHADLSTLQTADPDFGKRRGPRRN